MTAPLPHEHDDFVARHLSLDDRLEEAFRRYDAAFYAHRDRDLVTARIDLSLILWADEDLPAEVRQQVALDGEKLLRETPPLS